MSPGSGPGQAAGGTLKVAVTNPVKSGARFQVRGIVTNRVSQPINVNLLFVTPTDSTFDSQVLPSGCTKLSNQQAECKVKQLQPGEDIEVVVSYDAPKVTASKSIEGGVVLLTSDFSPYATYETVVQP